MSKEWRKALFQWQEPGDGAIHEAGDVYQIDTDVVFDDASLIERGTHVPASENEITAVTAALETTSKPAKMSKTPPTTPESEAQ